MTGVLPLKGSRAWLVLTTDSFPPRRPTDPRDVLSPGKRVAFGTANRLHPCTKQCTAPWRLHELTDL
jgi:hypothetical protein